MNIIDRQITDRPDGIYSDIEFSEYLQIPRISKHGLDQIAITPGHYQHGLAHPRAPTAAQALGTAVHTLVLEPDSFERIYAVAPEGIDKRKKLGKDAWASFQFQAEGKTIISAEQHEIACAMAANVRANPVVATVLLTGRPEVTMLWTDPQTGVRCKGRADWLCDDMPVIMDLKTAKSAAMDEFGAAAGKYRYDVQDQMYTAGAEALGRPAQRFLFVVVESEPPYAVALYELNEKEKNRGWHLYRRDLEAFAECARTDSWPLYPQEIRMLSFPGWAHFVRSK